MILAVDNALRIENKNCVKKLKLDSIRINVRYEVILKKYITKLMSLFTHFIFFFLQKLKP